MIKIQSQDEYHKTSLRLPIDLHLDIRDAAARNGCSMNAEIIARLQASPADAVMVELAELKRMMRLVLDQI